MANPDFSEIVLDCDCIRGCSIINIHPIDEMNDN